MAIVLLEGFDHLTAVEATAKGWSANPNSMQAGRFDGQCFRLTSSATVTKALPSTYSTLFYGLAFRFSSLPGSTQDIAIFQAGATLSCRLGINTTGILVVRNSGGTVVATGTTILLVNVWYYLEFKAVIAGASGATIVQLNGASEIASTTGNFGSTNVDTVAINRSWTSNNDFDDIYVCDSSGSAPRNTFLNDVRVETIYPSGAGTHTQWTPLTSTNFSQVSEAQADGDTSYVSDSTPGDLDTYAFGGIDTSATVYAAQTCMYARKDDAAVRQIAPVIRQAGTDNVGTTVTLSSSYQFYTQLYNQDPTATNWTAANINADEFGVKEIA